MKPDEEKKAPEAEEAKPEAPKPDETLPEEALEGVAGGRIRGPGTAVYV
ncbi:MAG: hypothetical protein IK082_06545 [Oscillospiraceae bacterium]|nr:hypothetical protein [Oscillospiraceae bacterium]